jgi:hypothetical protein
VLQGSQRGHPTPPQTALLHAPCPRRSPLFQFFYHCLLLPYLYSTFVLERLSVRDCSPSRPGWSVLSARALPIVLQLRWSKSSRSSSAHARLNTASIIYRPLPIRISLRPFSPGRASSEQKNPNTKPANDPSRAVIFIRCPCIPNHSSSPRWRHLRNQRPLCSRAKPSRVCLRTRKSPSSR